LIPTVETTDDPVIVIEKASHEKNNDRIKLRLFCHQEVQQKVMADISQLDTLTKKSASIKKAFSYVRLVDGNL